MEIKPTTLLHCCLHSVRQNLYSKPEAKMWTQIRIIIIIMIIIIIIIQTSPTYFTLGSKNLDSFSSSGGFSMAVLNCSLFFALIFAYHGEKLFAIRTRIDSRNVTRSFMLTSLLQSLFLTLTPTSSPNSQSTLAFTPYLQRWHIGAFYIYDFSSAWVNSATHLIKDESSRSKNIRDRIKERRKYN